MSIQMDMRVTHLLCSRMCHDLISPASAVKTGVEFIQDTGSGMEADALSLLENSAGQLNAKLTFFRSAFGRGGEADNLSRVRELVQGLAGGGKVSLDWPMEAGDLALGRDAARLLLNLLFLAFDTVQVSGILTVRLANLSEGIGVAIAMEGRGVRIRDDLTEAMEPGVSIESLTPRSVQAYFVCRLTEDMGTTIEVSQPEPDRVEIASLLPTMG